MSTSRWFTLVVVCGLLGAAATGAFAGGGGGVGLPPNAEPPPLAITAFDAYSDLTPIWHFEGKWTGGDGSPVTITFGGDILGLIGKTAEVAADGTFTFSMILGPDDTGLVTATATNTSGQQSNVARRFVFQ